MCVCLYVFACRHIKYFWKDTQGTGNIVASWEGLKEGGERGFQHVPIPTLKILNVNVLSIKKNK